MSEGTALNILRREGVPRRSAGGRARQLTEKQCQRIVQLYQRGLSQDAIAAQLTTSQSKVSRVLRDRGIRTGRTHLQGQRHPRWRGGRLIVGGYVHVWADPTDPLAPAIAHKQGYALEHRLVMARHLGRPLHPSETVHHINGDRTDNRLENLQLRQGRHGKGVSSRCADCGSRNVIHDPLD